MPLLRALLAKTDDLCKSGFARSSSCAGDFGDGFEGGEEDVHRELKHDGTDGTAKDDHGRRWAG